MAKIFFSWQADTPRTTGKNLVHRALEAAVDQLNAEADVEDAARSDADDVDGHVVDMDTQGVPGSPPIVETIFSKIDEAAVFVADLTFVGQRIDGQRPMPNSNVLIEYGWALKSLSHTRVVAVMNSTYGAPTEHTMPFDIRHARFPITYECPADADEQMRAQVRKQLARAFREALGSSLALQNAAAPQPEFTPGKPVEGRARFRKSGDAIGIRHNTGEDIFFERNPATWLRLMPVRPLPAELKMSTLIAALWDGGITPRPEIPNLTGAQKYALRAPEGFGYYVRGDDGDDEAQGVMIALRTGEVWSLETFTAAGDSKVAYLDEDGFVQGLLEEATVLKGLGVNGPYKWIAGMEGLAGKALGTPGWVHRNKILDEVIEVQGNFSGDASEAKAALEPFFAKLFDAAGVSRREG